MSIIKSIQDWLKLFDGMELKTIDEILTDTAKENPSSYSLAPAGNNKTSTDILGNRQFQNSYVFYAKESLANEIDRQENYDFFECLEEWIEKQNDDENLPELPDGYCADGLEVSNAMLFDVDDNGTGTYQVQIQFIFTKKRS